MRIISHQLKNTCLYNSNTNKTKSTSKTWFNVYIRLARRCQRSLTHIHNAMNLKYLQAKKIVNKWHRNSRCK